MTINRFEGFKLTYVVLLFKPRASKTWLPWEVRDRDCGNFFATPEEALEYARKLVLSRPRKYVAGFKQVDFLEFTLGFVMQTDPDQSITGSPFII